MFGLYYYLRFVIKNKKILKEKYNVNIDRFFRMWTVVNVPEDKHSNIKSYGYLHLDYEVKDFIKKLDDFYMHSGVIEFISLKENTRLDYVNASIVMEYKNKDLANFFFWLYSIGAIAILTGLIILIFKIF